MTKETTDEMTIAVGMKIDGLSVKDGGTSFGGDYIVMPYKVKYSPLKHCGVVKGKMVDVSISSKDMVSVLEDMGYEVRKTEGD